MIPNLRHSLSSWYTKNKRALPWRQNLTPYRVWLSEIILQQTRVSQGLPYFNKFIHHFPDVAALATASEQQVLLLWQGLGYYTRARNLHKAAKVVMAKYEGEFPSTYKGLRSLPGVGDYTASAIASISFNLPNAVVDGNVLRVISRIFGVEEAVDSSSGQKRCKELAQKLLDPKHPGLHNQAVMELGALICKPLNPACMNCPAKSGCYANLFQKQNEFPIKNKGRKIKNRYFHYFLVRRENKILLKKREGKDIWMNLYDLPMIEKDSPGNLDEREISSYFPDQSFKFASSYNRTHLLTHQKIEARFYDATGLYKTPEAPNLLWVAEDEIEQYPQPKLIQDYLKEKM